MILQLNLSINGHSKLYIRISVPFSRIPEISQLLNGPISVSKTKLTIDKLTQN